MKRYIAILAGLVVLIASGLATSGCSAVSASVAKPTVVISSPASNSQYHEGDTVAVQSTSNDLAGISRVDLLVDGAIVRTDPSPQPQVSFTVIQTWTATIGPHTIEVRAVNAANGESQPAAVTIMVLAGVTPTTATPTPATKATSTPSARACLNSTFVTDVTVPDGTALAGGQAFNKIWRVRNAGTCAWSSGDALVFVSGEPMTGNTVVALPATPPGATADLLVPITAPGTLGVHSGSWRMRSSGGGFFGTLLTVAVNVVSVAPPPAACNGTPTIQSFTASSTTISPGESVTLNWGFVSNAERASIDNGIGGVATPGSTTVTPGSTTTYTLTATCGGRVATAQVTINVVSATTAPTVTPTSTSTSPPPTATHTATPTP